MSYFLGLARVESPGVPELVTFLKKTEEFLNDVVNLQLRIDEEPIDLPPHPFLTGTLWTMAQSQLGNEGEITQSFRDLRKVTEQLNNEKYENTLKAHGLAGSSLYFKFSVLNTLEQTYWPNINDVLRDIKKIWEEIKKFLAFVDILLESILDAVGKIDSCDVPDVKVCGWGVGGAIKEFKDILIADY